MKSFTLTDREDNPGKGERRERERQGLECEEQLDVSGAERCVGRSVVRDGEPLHDDIIIWGACE